jgi:hypothetical protein
MGNVLGGVGGFASAFSSAARSVYNSTDEDEQKMEVENKTKHDSKLQSLKIDDNGGDDTLQLLHFLAKQGVDVTDVSRLIDDLLKRHSDNRCHRIYRALGDKICLNKPFKETLATFEQLLNTVIAARDMRNRNQTGDKTTFYGNMDGLLATMSVAGAGAMGTIVVKLLEGIQKVNFFEKSCETKGYLDRQIGITDITWTDEDNGIIAFEVAKISLQMLSKSGELVFIGGSNIKVEVDAFYARATIELRDLFPNENERKEVVQIVQHKVRG